MDEVKDVVRDMRFIYSYKHNPKSVVDLSDMNEYYLTITITITNFYLDV